MTKITIFKKEGKIYAYKIKGHSGFAEEGKDIVCSAISTAGQMTLLGLCEVLNVKVQSDIQDGYMQVEVLENHTDIAADFGKAFGRRLGEVLAVDDDLSFGGAFKHVDAPNEGAFSRT